MAAKKTTTPAKPKPKRLIIDVPPDVHAQIKSKSALAGKSIREYVLDLLAKDGIV